MLSNELPAVNMKHEHCINVPMKNLVTHVTGPYVHTNYYDLL
jgi:hypothetical protein